MNTLNDIFENKFISAITGKYKRQPLQINALHESDAELIKIPGTDAVLALTTDNIVEEIEKGLYSEPYLIGWMAVIVNVSDLSAVGALPLGILINETLSTEFDEQFINEIHRGINDACTESGIYVLGGDTNFAQKPQIGGCACGIIYDKRILSRKGACKNDLVFTTGLLGNGNAYALNKFYLNDPVKFDFKPLPRFKESSIIRKYASACMDTSDGAIAALDQLMRINGCGFRIDSGIEDILSGQALNISSIINFPLWLNLAGIHGEFELLFTISEKNKDGFIAEAFESGWKPVLLGKVTEEKSLKIIINSVLHVIDSCKIRNLYEETQGNLQNYIEQLMLIDSSLTETEKEFIK
jgi:thiamine-monophosphate kinase